jgi:dihydrofolate reductase
MAAQTRRRVRYQVVQSLDGFIAGPNGEADWIPMDSEIDFAAHFAQFDTLLMGRRTFAGMVGQGGVSGGRVFGKETVVVSRTLGASAHPGLSIVRDDLTGAITALREKPGRDIWLFGGGELFRSLAELGLVDSVEVVVAPILLGQGVPLYPGPAGQVRMSLRSSRVFEKTGLLMLDYGVEPPAGVDAFASALRRSATP